MLCYIRLCDGPDFCDPPGGYRAGPGIGPEKMNKNGLNKSDAATFLLDLVFLSQTYMVGTKNKDYLLEEIYQAEVTVPSAKKKSSIG